MVTLKAKAKINLFLHINDKRSDSYHNLQSLIVFCDDIFDEITIAKNLLIEISGEFAPSLSALQTNIIASVLQHYGKNDYGYHLSKNIPVAAGLGGGSSDAAMVFAYFNQFNPLDLHAIENLRLFGSDVPVCYNQSAAFIQQTGEKIEQVLNLPKFYAILINPLKKVITKDIFQQVSVFTKPLIDFNTNFKDDFKQLLNFLKAQSNDLTGITVKAIPEVKTIIDFCEQKTDSAYSAMSGSGPTCFALYENQSNLDCAYQKLLSAFPNYWIKTTKIS